MGKARILGAALIAMLAMGAVGSAPASGDELTSEKYPVTLTGKTDQGSQFLLTTTAGSTSCTDVTYDGTVSGALTTVTVIPSLSGCIAFGFPVTTHMNSCGLLFHINGASSTEGKVDIECTKPGDEITDTAIGAGTTKCTFHIPPQSDISGALKYSTIGAGTTREITVDVNLSGIDYTHTKGTGIAACLSGSSTSGTLEAKIVLTGEVAGGSTHIGVFLSNA